jgi:hypothetical protein
MMSFQAIFNLLNAHLSQQGAPDLRRIYITFVQIQKGLTKQLFEKAERSS